MTTTTAQEALTTALQGRTLKPSALAADQSHLVVDGFVDETAMQQWVENHSTPDARQSGKESVEAGRAAYNRRHPQTTTHDNSTTENAGTAAYRRRHPARPA